MPNIENIPNWLRWTLVPVAVVVTNILATIIITLLYWVQDKFDIFGTVSWIDIVWRNIISPFATIYLSVYAGVFVSPSNKIFVAIVIGSIAIIFLGVFFMSAFSSENWMSVVSIISTTVGVGVAIYTTFDDERKSKF
jgi:hypothetical protein